MPVFLELPATRHRDQAIAVFFSRRRSRGNTEATSSEARLPPLSTSNLYQPPGLAARPRSCSTVTTMTSPTSHAVVIAGGGPTGLMLSAELALARINVAIIERRPNQNLAGSRAGGLHARTIEVLDQRGVADR